MPFPKTGATHYLAQLEISDKVHAIKGLVVCYVVWLGSMKGIGLRNCTKCVGLVPCCGQDGCQVRLFLGKVDRFIVICS